MPDFFCDLTGPSTPFPHFWEHTVGSGHAPLALRQDWQTHLALCHRDLGFRHVRFHALLSDEMGTLVNERGRLLYSFFNADRIIDFLLSIGMRPFIELSFMPEALASGPATVFRYKANITPPQDYDKWAELIFRLTSHWVARYGLAEVREWFFEVWNEPNLPMFWTGSQQDYFRLYQHTVTAIKRVDASLKVGGPATADSQWLPEFIAFCQMSGLNADFVSTHHYPTDAFGQPGADTLTQLQHAPRDIMREQVIRARSQCANRPLFYTEWNISSNPRDTLHDEPFAAAYATRIIMQARSLIDVYSFWTFSDIFNENYSPSVPFHGGFGLLNIHGIPKPIYRAFQLLHNLGDQMKPLEGEHETVDAWLICKNEAGHSHSITILLTNLAMPRHPVHRQTVHLRLTGATAPIAAWTERIDEDHANPRRLWQNMGEPEYLTSSHVEQLKLGSFLRKEIQPWKLEHGELNVTTTLPPQSVTAVTLRCT